VLPPLPAGLHVGHNSPNAAANTSTPTGVLKNGFPAGTFECNNALSNSNLPKLRRGSPGSAKPAAGKRQKIILGGMLLAAARHNSKIRASLIKEAGKGATRACLRFTGCVHFAMKEYWTRQKKSWVDSGSGSLPSEW
jgi:hypothetical protein